MGNEVLEQIIKIKDAVPKKQRFYTLSGAEL